MDELGCAFYAGSGQKWLCGPEGSGTLYVRRDQLDELTAPWPGYALAGRCRGRVELRPRARTPAALTTVSRRGCAAPGRWRRSRCWRAPAGSGCTLARRRSPHRWPNSCPNAVCEVGPRGRSTLVSWKVDDPDAEVDRLAEAGVVVRSILSHGLVRASVGAWSDEEELVRVARARRCLTAPRSHRPRIHRGADRRPHVSRGSARDRYRRSASRAARTRTASGRGRRPVRSPASWAPRPRSGSARRRLPPSGRARTTAVR